MEFQVTFPFHDNSSMKELGVGACVFVSGGLASYILFHYFPTISDDQEHHLDLADHMNELRDDIKKLKSRLAAALGEFTRGVTDIRVSHERLSNHILNSPDVPIPLPSAVPSGTSAAHKSSFYPKTSFYPQNGSLGSPKASVGSPKISLASPKGSIGSPHGSIPTQKVSMLDPKASMLDTKASMLFRPKQASFATSMPASAGDLHKSLAEIRKASIRKSSGDMRKASLDTLDDDDDYQSVTDVLESPEDIREAETLKPVLDEVDRLCVGTDADREKVLVILEQEEMAHPNSWRIKWRLARAHLALYGESENYEERRIQVQTAFKYAQEALDLNQTSADVHKWYAVALAASLDFKTVDEKNNDAELVKKHLDRAIELDPLEPMPLFIKGKWCWGIYKLKWIEKKLTGALYGAPPHVSVEEIIDSFMKAEDLAPGFYKANRLFLGKCYYEKEDFVTSKDWLDAALTLPINNPEDARLQQEIHNVIDTIKN